MCLYFRHGLPSSSVRICATRAPKANPSAPPSHLNFTRITCLKTPLSSPLLVLEQYCFCLANLFPPATTLTGTQLITSHPPRPLPPSLPPFQDSMFCPAKMPEPLLSSPLLLLWEYASNAGPGGRLLAPQPRGGVYYGRNGQCSIERAHPRIALPRVYPRRGLHRVRHGSGGLARTPGCIEVAAHEP